LTRVMSSALLATADKCREGLAFIEAQGNTFALDPDAVIEQLRCAVESEAAIEQESAQPTQESQTREVAKTEQKSIPNSTATPQPAPSVALADNSTNEKPTLTASESTIRVDVELLDKLMTRVGELVLARNQILQHTAKLDDSNFISTAQR